MPNSYFIDTSRDFKTHGPSEWRVFGHSKTKEELRASIDILSERLETEKQLNTKLRSSIDILSERLKTEKQLNERLDRENTQWEGEVDKLKKTLFNAEHNLEATELSLKVSQEEIVALKRKCEKCDAVCDALRKERSNLESENEVLMRKNNIYLNEVERRREENASLQKDLTVAKQIMETIKKDHKMNYEDKLEEIRRLQNKNVSLQKALQVNNENKEHNQKNMNNQT